MVNFVLLFSCYFFVLCPLLWERGIHSSNEDTRTNVFFMTIPMNLPPVRVRVSRDTPENRTSIPSPASGDRVITR